MTASRDIQIVVVPQAFLAYGAPRGYRWELPGKHLDREWIDTGRHRKCHPTPTARASQAAPSLARPKTEEEQELD
jgi:hypothetical protein